MPAPFSSGISGQSQRKTNLMGILAGVAFSVEEIMDLIFDAGVPDLTSLNKVFYSSVFISHRYNHAFQRIGCLAVAGWPHMPFDDIRRLLRQILHQPSGYLNRI